MSDKVTVTVSGPTGCGKTAIYTEIMLALKAIGVPVEHADPQAFNSEMAMGHSDTDSDLALYRPTVVLVETNEARHPRTRREP